MKVKIKRLTKTAIIPEYKSSGAAAFDLHADIDTNILINAQGIAIQIPTGLSIQIPEGYVGIIASRSGIGIKKGLIIAHGVGIIDSDYRGPLILPIWNRSGARRIVKPSDRIAQMLIMPVEQVELIEVDELDGSLRGSNGFGSTGT